MFARVLAKLDYRDDRPSFEEATPTKNAALRFHVVARALVVRFSIGL